MTKDNKRYVRFELHRDGPPVTDRQLSNAIRKSLLLLFGEIVVADSKFFLTEYDEQSGAGIMQCGSRSLSNVMAAASLVSEIDGTKVSFQPKKTSGTLKSLR